jgi:PilZ domain
MNDGKKSSIKKGSSCYLLNVKQPDRTAKRLKLGFRAVTGTVFLPKSQRSLEASVGLLDISETGAGIYTGELLRKGAPIEITLTEPFPLKVSGMVIWSIPVTSSVHNARFRCRSGVKFLFPNENSQAAVADFIEKISIDPVEALKNALNAPPVVMPPMPGGSPSAALAAASEADAASAAQEAPAPEAPAADASAAVVADAPVADAPVTPAAEAAAAPAADSVTAPVAEVAPTAPDPAAAAAAPDSGSGELDPQGGSQAA